MASFNKVLLMGNLTRDPQLKYLPSQTALVEFGVACSRKFKTAQGEEREETTFVDVTAFGKQGQVINQYFQKGKPIFIEGRLKYDSWEDKNGGGKRSKITVVVENVQFVGDRDGNAGGGYDDEAPPRRAGPPERDPQQRTSQQPARAPAPRARVESPISEEQRFKDDDIPF